MIFANNTSSDFIRRRSKAGALYSLAGIFIIAPTF
jgi:hypothetical protein